LGRHHIGTSQSQARALIIPVTPFQQNRTLLWSDTSKRAAVIDPGGDLANIERVIADAGVSVEKIWLTHGHVDHASGAAELKERLRVPVEGPRTACTRRVRLAGHGRFLRRRRTNRGPCR
jgi:hydroxyacylglutathione hydrolase